MANWSNLKSSINSVIKTNANQEITGQVLQNVLNTIVSTLGENATYVGVATPTTNPGTPDGNVFYFATQAGTYANFGGAEVEVGLTILLWNGSTWSATKVMTIKQEVGSSESSVMSQRIITNLVSEYNVSVNHPTEGIDGTNKYTLETAIEKIPASLRKVGIKCSFINESGVPETWEYHGYGSYNKVGYSKFLDIENLLSINKQELDTYKEYGYLKENGTLSVQGDWITYYKIPVNEGDIVRAEGMTTVSVDNSANFVVYDLSGTVTHFEKTNNVDYKIKEDGFVSVTYYIADNISVRLLSIQHIIDMIDKVEKKIGDIQSLWNDYYELFKKDGYYLNDKGGILYEGGGWVAFQNIPIKKGATFSAKFGYTPAYAGSSCVVISGNDGEVIQSYNQTDVTYTFSEDGYLSFCLLTTVDNSYTIRNEDSVSEFIELFYKLVYTISQKISKVEDLSIEVYADAAISDLYYKDKYYLNDDGTITIQGGWGAYYKVPVKKGNIFKYKSGLIPTIAGSTCFVAYNTDGTVIYSEKSLNITYTCEYDGFISFCYYIPYNHEFSIKYNTTLKDYIASQLGSGSKKIKWCAIGDSITAGNESNTEASYATVAAELLGERVELIKLGYWGQRIQNVLITHAFNEIPEDTDIVTMNLGSNDIFDYPESGWGNVDEIIAKERDDLQENVSTFENLRLFFEKMREERPSTLIYVMNPIKRAKDDITSRFNEQEKKMCDYYSIPYLDAFNESGIRYHDPLYTSDLTHPNDAGRLMIARWLVSKISFLNL